MTYARVVPRDLFNEGDLLNCLGRLWIKLDERRDHRAELIHTVEDRFEIDQDQSDGSISCASLALHIAGGDSFHRPRLFRPLNSREKWPLWASLGDEEIRVLDLEGELSPEFWIAITEGTAR